MNETKIVEILNHPMRYSKESRIEASEGAAKVLDRLIFCKNCIYFSDWSCQNLYNPDGSQVLVDAEDFCSMGVRKRGN